MSSRPGVARARAAPRRSRGRGERGLVTVELAVGFVTATLLAAVLVGVVLLGVAQAAATRTSAEVARQLARGDAAAAELAREQAPEGAGITVRDVDDGVEVRVEVPVDVFGIGEVDVADTSWARYETGAAP